MLRSQDRLQWSHAQLSVEMRDRRIDQGTFIWLQWSHAQLSVEICERGFYHGLYIGLQWSHAQLSVEILERATERRLVERASMEPRSAERGNAPIATMMRYTSIALQWSHAQLSVEIQHRPIIVSLNPKLQWSHAQLSVEIPFSSPAASLPRRFNGATLS